MPELPEVETIKSGLKPHLINHSLLDVHSRRNRLRYNIPKDLKQKLAGQKITRFHRRGKYLLIDFENKVTLLFHLGMSGSLRIKPWLEFTSSKHRLAELVKTKSFLSCLNKHDHILFLTSQNDLLIYNDPRRFGFVDLIPTHRLSQCRWLSHMGVEPLGKTFNSAYLQSQFKSKTLALKTALLDQHIIAGLGNIYVCEALFRAKLSPYQPVNTLIKEDINRLITKIQSVLAEALDAGGSSLKDYVMADGSLGYFQQSLRVYKRETEPCPEPGCQAFIVRSFQQGRSTYFCPSCQPFSKPS